MNNEPLAPIFLDNKPIALKDPKPSVSSVLSAGGQAGATEVKWLQSQTGTQGTFLRLDHTLDRTSEPTKAIYLTSLVRGPSSAVRGPAPPVSTGPNAGQVAIVDEDIVARPTTAASPTTTKQWPVPPTKAKEAADDEAMDADADEEESGDGDSNADSGDDDRAAGTKSGE